MSSAKLRLFIGVSPGRTVLERVVEGAARLRAECERIGLQVGWTLPGNFHLTLKFLGETEPEKLGLINEALRSLCGEFPEFELRLAGVGAFPGEDCARVIWVGADDGGKLQQLAKAVESEMEKLGFAPEDRAYSAHLTIGKIRRAASVGDLLSCYKKSEFGVSLIREAILYESIPGPGGSCYMVRARFPLRANG